MQSGSTHRRKVGAWQPTSPSANNDTVVAVYRRLDGLIKQWRVRSIEQKDISQRLTGRPAIQAEMHARVLGALADECRRVLVECGLEAGVPATLKRSKSR